MALKQTDIIRFEGLNQTASILRANGFDFTATEAAMAAQLTEFEATARHKVKLLKEPVDGVFLEVIDLSRDFIRTRKPNEESLVLRTKIQNVPIEVKLVKDGEYCFDNTSVANALRELAKEVESISFALSELDNEDVRALMSEEQGNEGDRSSENEKQDTQTTSVNEDKENEYFNTLPNPDLDDPLANVKPFTLG